MHDAYGLLGWHRAQQLGWNDLKVGVSEAALDLVIQCMRVREIAGFCNDVPFSGAHHLPDITSGMLMVGNEQVVANSAGLVLLQAP